MSMRIYLVPVVGGSSFADPLRPKYLNPIDGFVTLLPFEVQLPPEVQSLTMGTSTLVTSYYKPEPVVLVGASLSDSDHTLVVSQSDASTVPVNIDALLSSGQVTAVQNQLEALNIPAGWVGTNDSWRSVLRVIFGIFSFTQRYYGKYAEANGTVAPPLFAEGRSLSTQFQSLPTAMQNAMTAAAGSFTPPLDTSGLQPTTTLRAIFKAMGDQFNDRLWPFGSIII